VSLLVSLIFLVIIAMLGITVANVSGLEEKMASNTRDRDLALQAAEASLRDAEVRLADPAFRATATAFVVTSANSANYWETCFTTHVTPCLVGNLVTPTLALPSSGPGAVNAQPQYVVERKPDVGTTQIYRITARAVGGTQDAVVVLQAEYGY
jgi:type IV pilus assembly protein PilX